MRILVISDIHSNLPALEAVLLAAGTVDFAICLGDIVDYGPQPAECLAVIQERADIVVMGNHDYAVGTGFDPGCSPAYRHLAETTRDFTISKLDSASRHYLESLPLDEQYTVGNIDFHIVHAQPSNRLYGYMRPDTPDIVWESELSFCHAPDVVLLGHTHLPMIKTIGRTEIVNPGSVGQPKDGDTRAAYAIWEDDEFQLCRAEYDIWKTADAYKSTDLRPSDVARLVAILRSGGLEGP